MTLQVARVMDYSEVSYEQEQRAKQAHKHQSTINIKEIKFRPKIPAATTTRPRRVTSSPFLNQQAKVKVTIMFRGGRTSTRSGVGCSGVSQKTSGSWGAVEQQPTLDSPEHGDGAGADEERRSETRCRR